MSWHRSVNVTRGRFGKLHIGVSRLHGGYRAACKRSIILFDQPYPENRFDEAKAKGRFCKLCLELDR